MMESDCPIWALKRVSCSDKHEHLWGDQIYRQQQVDKQSPGHRLLEGSVLAKSLNECACEIGESG